MMNQYGLKQEDLNYILDQFKKFKEIKEVILFGSRAMGNYKPGSDIDLALIGVPMHSHTTHQLKALLEEEGPLPFFSDVINIKEIDNKNLLAHIKNHGIKIYSSNTNSTKQPL